jgi:hypothetical protein
MSSKCDNKGCIGGRAFRTDESVRLDPAKEFCSYDCADEHVEQQTQTIQAEKKTVYDMINILMRDIHEANVKAIGFDDDRKLIELSKSRELSKAFRVMRKYIKKLNHGGEWEPESYTDSTFHYEKTNAKGYKYYSNQMGCISGKLIVAPTCNVGDEIKVTIPLINEND